MDWKYASLVFLVLGVACLPFWPYSLNWSIYPSLFCWFVMILTFLVSIFAKHGSTIWRGKGHS